MSLSGADKLAERVALMDGLRALDPAASTHMHICTDTYGAIATASNQGLASIYSLVIFISWFLITTILEIHGLLY